MTAPLRAIVGLGNPGTDYERTRHNAGFWLVDRLAALHKGTLRSESKFKAELGKLRIGDTDVLLLKPLTFMNLSGESVQKVAQFYKLTPADILIAHDELDLPAGTMRLKVGGGHGGHNGLRSLHQHLGADYLRLRMGIGHPGHKDQVLGYVLGRPNKADQEAIDAGIENAAIAIHTWLTQTWAKAVHQLHTER